MRSRPLFELASGGMGTVSLALREDGVFKRLVALKRPNLQNEDARQMFVEEARIAGLIRHVNVASVLDVGEDTHGPFLLMDYVDGPSLRALLRRTDDVLPVQVVLDIARQVAAGLHAAHELRDAGGNSLSLVHRDVSPDNILLGFDGVARLTDFGIAKASGRTHERTAEGVLKGKLGYMAPELLRFDEPTVQSDLFAFGVVLFEALTGERLYSRRGGTDRDVAKRILEEAPPDLGDIRDDVPPRIDELLFDLLAKNPAKRPTSAGEVVEILDDVWAERVAIDGRLPLGEALMHHFADWRIERTQKIEDAVARLDAGSTRSLHPSPTVRAKPRRVLIAAALALCVAAGAAFAFTSRSEPAPAPAESPPRTAIRQAPAMPTLVEVPTGEPVDDPTEEVRPTHDTRPVHSDMRAALGEETNPRTKMHTSRMRVGMAQEAGERPFGTWGWK